MPTARLKLFGVCRLDAFCNGSDRSVIGRVLPGSEVIAVQPNNVGKMFVAVAQISAVSPTGSRAIVPQRVDPLPGLDGIKENHHPAIGRECHDLIDMAKVCFVRLGEIIMGGI
jgi:hypothetical protein